MSKFCQCGKDINYMNHRAKYCKECKPVIKKEQQRQRAIKRSIKQYKDVLDIPTCKICGMKGKSLLSHINNVHGLSLYEYKEKYNCENIDILHKSYTDKLGLNGKDNPAYNHGGKLSPFSKNFIKYEGLTENEIENEISHIKDKVAKTKEKEPWKKGNNNIGYWLYKGYNEDGAKKKLSERQSTFSKNICIEKYGEKEGLKVWKNRQDKWQDTMKSKPREEIERINKAKRFKNSFSKISQELFWMLYEHIKHDFNEIYFAQLGPKKGKDLTGKNHEYMLFFEDRSIAYPDFFIKDKSLVIEFDGDYWHNLSEMKERDIERDKKIIDNGYKLLHIKECDWNSDKINVIEICKEFIYGKTT